MSKITEIRQSLNKVMALPNTGTKIYRSGFITVVTFSDDIGATIELDTTTLRIDVTNKHDGELIGSKHYTLTTGQRDKIRKLLFDTYWPQ